MAISETNLPQRTEDAAPPASSLLGYLRWLTQVARVRLRFLIVVLVAGTIVGQWPLLRGVWDRWTWGHQHQSGSGTVSGSQEYFCPMDPGVISVWPAICPICNMDLVPRKKMEAQMLPDGVISRMQLSPYRIQLAGIRTAVIESRPLRHTLTLTGTVQQQGDGSLGFDAQVTATDAALFANPCQAEVRTRSSTQPFAATAKLLESLDPLRIRLTLDRETPVSPGTIVTAVVGVPVGDGENCLAVPESAVVDRGTERLVYVETMPGLFDGVAVELGQRCDAYYPVTRGLKAGQRVASAGAFLIDAETRLNPGLAAGYFGANQSNVPSSAAPAVKKATATPASKKSGSPKNNLSKEDRALVEKQRICPVTELALDSMGGPVPVMVAGRKIFICCAGCEQRLKDEPEKYLAKMPAE